VTASDGDNEERLVSEVSTYADGFGRGVFLTEQAAGALAEAHALLEAAVIADRMRGASWGSVAEALDTSSESARERFAPSEHEFRDALLFPHRYSENGGLGNTVASYAVEAPGASWTRSPTGSPAAADTAPRARVPKPAKPIPRR